MNFYAFSALVNILLCSFLAILLFVKREKPRSVAFFNLFNLAVLFWSASYFFWQTSADYISALFWVKMLMIGGVMIGPTFFHFVLVFTDHEKRWVLPLILSYLVGLAMIYLDWFSPTFIVGLSTKLGLPFFPTGGVAFYVYLLQWSVWVALAFGLLFRFWKQGQQAERGFRWTILVVTAVAFSAGALNFFLWFDIPIPPVTMMVSSIYSVIVTSLLLRGKFYQVQLYYFEFFVAAAVLISLVQFLFQQDLNKNWTSFTVLGLLFLASYWVVKNGLREKKYLEKILMMNQSLLVSLRQILDSVDSPAIIAGQQGKILATNGNARRLFGYDVDTQPDMFLDFTRGKVNRDLWNAWNTYWQGGSDNATVEISLPDPQKIKVTFFPFTHSDKNDSAILIFK